jgi:hypothetical protein
VFMLFKLVVIIIALWKVRWTWKSSKLHFRVVGDRTRF